MLVECCCFLRGNSVHLLHTCSRSGGTAVHQQPASPVGRQRRTVAAVTVAAAAAARAAAACRCTASQASSTASPPMASAAACPSCCCCSSSRISASQAGTMRQPSSTCSSNARTWSAPSHKCHTTSCAKSSCNWRLQGALLLLAYCCVALHSSSSWQAEQHRALRSPQAMLRFSQRRPLLTPSAAGRSRPGLLGTAAGTSAAAARWWHLQEAAQYNC